MAGKKYAKQVFQNIREKSINPDIVEPIIHFDGERHGGGINFMLSQTPITKPFMMIKAPHKHDFDQIIFFLGTNPENDKEFDAEIEFYLGDEQEKYVITVPTIIHIPKGLTHGPLNYKRIGKPVNFLDVCLTPKYIRKPQT